MGSLRHQRLLDATLCRALYHCNYCQKDISNVPRIKCAECKDFDLCLECFSVGVEIKPHKNTHDYQVVENLSFPIFHPDWGVSMRSTGLSWKCATRCTWLNRGRSHRHTWCWWSQGCRGACVPLSLQAHR